MSRWRDFYHLHREQEQWWPVTTCSDHFMKSFIWLTRHIIRFKKNKGKQQATLVSCAQPWAVILKTYWAGIGRELSYSSTTLGWNSGTRGIPVEQVAKIILFGASDRAAVHKLSVQRLSHSLNCSMIFIVPSLTPFVPISRKSHQRYKIHKINGETGLYTSESSFQACDFQLRWTIFVDIHQCCYLWSYCTCSPMQLLTTRNVCLFHIPHNLPHLFHAGKRFCSVT